MVHKIISKPFRISMTSIEWNKMELVCRKETRTKANFIVRAVNIYLNKYNNDGEIIQR